MVSLLTDMPPEAVVNILLFLPQIDIQRCKLVSRLLYSIIHNSPHLQYLLELDRSGYVTPINPLVDLSFSEKVHILQEKQNRTRDPDIKILDTIGLGGANRQFSRGVFAIGGPSLDVTSRLNLYRHSSRNDNTPSWRHSLADLGPTAHDFRIDPDFDLLVLLEIVHSPPDPETDLQMRFHLRSLYTGLNHPLAALPVITGNFKFTSTYIETGFQIVGRLLVILCHTNSLLDRSSPRIYVWDWTAGDLVTSTEVPGHDFAFLSEDTFAVSYGRRKWDGVDIIGSLELFTFADVPAGGRARHIASLHLPPTLEGPCHSTFRFLATPLAPATLHTQEPPIFTTPPRVYEIGPSSHYICLQVRAFNIKIAPSEMSNGTLFIPSASVLQVLKSAAVVDSRSRLHIPWENWAHGTSWINNRHLRSQTNCVFGHRVALLDLNHELNAWQVLIYDLRVKLRDLDKCQTQRKRTYDMQRADTFLDAVFTSSTPEAPEIRAPPMVASFTVSKYGDLVEQLTIHDPLNLMIDDEHVIIFKEGHSGKASSLHVHDL